MLNLGGRIVELLNRILVNDTHVLELLRNPRNHAAEPAAHAGQDPGGPALREELKAVLEKVVSALYIVEPYFTRTQLARYLTAVPFLDKYYPMTAHIPPFLLIPAFCQITPQGHSA